MTTSMHRLQISLPEWQVQFLTDRAQRDGISIAEVVRQMVRSAAKAQAQDQATGGLRAIAGIADDANPLLNGVPVSESPELYLTAATAEARNRLAEIQHDLERAARIEVTRRGRPVAVLISIEEYERLASRDINFVEPADGGMALPTDRTRFWASFGGWKDGRPVEETLSDIHSARHSKVEPPAL